MENKTLSKNALDLLEQYLHFHIGSAQCSIPYFNNRTKKNRASLRVHIGKGSPQDIKEEVETIIHKEKIDKNSISNEALKKTLVDNELGIECSGFVYHMLEAESQARKLGTISKQINFIYCQGFIGQIKCTIRPVENCDVNTFAHDSNSTAIDLKEVCPGDIITMINDQKNSERNHVLIVKEVRYIDNKPKFISYAHSIAYPEDGLYETGVREGQIEIIDETLPLSSQKWSRENNVEQLALRAQRSKTEIRRLKLFQNN